MIEKILRDAQEHLDAQTTPPPVLPLDETTLREIKSRANVELPNPPFSTDVWLVGINVAKYLADQTLQGNQARIHYVPGPPEDLGIGRIGELRFTPIYADLRVQALPPDGVFYVNLQQGRNREFTDLNGLIGFIAKSE